MLVVASLIAFVAIRKGDGAIEVAPWKFKFTFSEKLAQQKSYRETGEPDLVTKPDKPNSKRNREK